MSQQEPKKKDRVMVCPKCSSSFVNSVDDYVKHRITCSNNNPRVISALRQIGLDPDKFLK